MHFEGQKQRKKKKEEPQRNVVHLSDTPTYTKWKYQEERKETAERLFE